MMLNGTELKSSDEGNLPELIPVKEQAGILQLAPGTCTFLVV